MDFFKQAYNRENYLGFLAGKFKFKKFIQTVEIDNNEVESFDQLGFVTTSDDKQLPVFEIHIKPNTRLSRNRVQLRNLAAKEIQTEDGALAVYVDEPNKQWRFSFIAIEYHFTEDGSTGTQTASKRFTYLLGENAKTKTARERFGNIGQQSTLKDLKEAFAVEPLNKEFYGKLYTWYKKAQEQIIFPNDEQAENHTQTSLIRLLTRLLFIWFIKEKKLINPDLFDKTKLPSLIDYEQPGSFYKAILQNLFFATLSTEIKHRDFRSETDFQGKNKDYGNQYRYRYHTLVKDERKWNASFSQTPFLNGGLFECLDRKLDKKNADDKKLIDEWDENIRPEKTMLRMDGFSEHQGNQLSIENKLFFHKEDDSGLIDLFNQYQFTVEESTPSDIEVALDPELLGKVFENLLASYNPETGQQARKATGSFYTPREIVSYMVDESLKQYFKQHTDLDGSQINDLFIEKENTLDDQQTKTLIHAIDNLKILDPAVGSGAYPMGILQRLVSILEKVDPGNIHFKEQQIDKAERIPDEASRDSAIVAIEQVFSQENQHNAYGKKLMLIENCIYGVDIQSVAIQICKLRFFISLTIEQSPGQDENDNYGIKALPNLETRFIAANSLLPVGEMPNTKQFGIFDTGIAELQKELAEVRHKHFSARTLKTKRKYRDEDKSLRQQMLKELTKSGITPGVEASMRKIVNWDLYNQNATADWFDPEWMFGVKQGFDIVIGNPPYIQLQKDGGLLGNLYQNRDFKTFARTGDIYQLFYERGMELLTEAQGNLAFITSNSWMRARYGEKLRRFFSAETSPLRLIDMGKDAFEAVVDTNILLAGKGSTEQEFKAVDMDSVSEKQFPPAEQYWSKNQFYGDMAWSILSAAAQKIRAKIEQIGTPLKEWDIKINFGIKTGYNQAFIIDTVKRDELIAEDPKSAEIIKPILRGRDVGRYGYKWAGKWLIATFPVLKINIGDYPAVKNHLLTFGKERLEQAGKKLSDGTKSRKQTSNKWFETQDQIGYHAEFAKEKLIWKRIGSILRFSFDGEGHFPLDSTCIITGERIKFLVAVLNSRLGNYLLKDSPTTGMGDLIISVQAIEPILVPRISTKNHQLAENIEKLVDKILAAKQQAQDTTALEAQIDQMVYKLYQLTTDEIKIIEGKK